MALASYTDLKASIAGWLNRRDLTAVIPDFIRLAEDDINARLRDRRMQKRVEATFTGQPVALPSDWIEAARVSPEGEAQPLEPVSLVRLQELRAARQPLVTPAPGDPQTGRPLYFAVNGGLLELYPAPGGSLTLEMTYFAKLPRLTDAAPTNWLLDEDAGIYLYGALIQAAPYLKDDARLPVWAALFKEKIEARNAVSRLAAYAGGALKRARRGF